MIEAVSGFGWAVVLFVVGVVAAFALHFVYEIVVVGAFMAGYTYGKYGVPFLVDRGLFPRFHRR